MYAFFWCLNCLLIRADESGACIHGFGLQTMLLNAIMLKCRNIAMYRFILKRLIDILLSTAGFVILLPVFLVLTLWIKADSPGPVFFKQRRIGIHKKEFDILKFRTMYIDTPKDIPTHMLADPEKYITKAGRFLRKTSLDELPQLINIIRGDMSIVGPRPALYNQYDLIEERDKYGANDVMPGLTGWAQINGRDELEIPVKAALDGYYTEHIGFLMDCRCFFGTFSAVLSGRGIAEGKKRERKKVLIITNHSYMLYRFRLELISKLMEQCEVVLSMPFVGHEDDFQAMGLKCINTPMERRGINPVKDLKLLKEYKRQLREEAPDLVITISVKPNIYAGYLCGKMHIPFAVMVQGLGSPFEKPVLAQLVTVMYRTGLKKAHRVLFENKDNAAVFVNKHIVEPEREVVLSGAGINLDLFEEREYPVNDVFRFLYVGRIMEEKGCGELFATVRRLHAENIPFLLDLVGFYEDDFREQVKELEDAGILQDHGFLNDPREYYALADCVVMPSYHEGMSNVLLEAAAMGRPLITTDVPGCREAVINEVSGLLCQPKDEESLYQAMKKMLGYTREQREAMGKEGHKHMVANFGKDAVVTHTIEALSEIL